MVHTLNNTVMLSLNLILFSFFFCSQRALNYFANAADAGNANALAFLGKVSAVSLRLRDRSIVSIHSVAIAESARGQQT